MSRRASPPLPGPYSRSDGDDCWLAASPAGAPADFYEDCQRYFELYNFAPVPYIRLDSNGVVEEINQAGCQMLAVPPGTILRHPLIVFVDVESRNDFLTHMRKCRASHAIVETEMLLETRTGRKREAPWTTCQRGDSPVSQDSQPRTAYAADAGTLCGLPSGRAGHARARTAPRRGHQKEHSERSTADRRPPRRLAHRTRLSRSDPERCRRACDYSRRHRIIPATVTRKVGDARQPLSSFPTFRLRRSWAAAPGVGESIEQCH